MRMIVLLFACIGVVLGLVAAWLWFFASRIEAKPVWGDHEPWTGYYRKPVGLLASLTRLQSQPD